MATCDSDTAKCSEQDPNKTRQSLAGLAQGPPARPSQQPVLQSTESPCKIHLQNTKTAEVS